MGFQTEVSMGEIGIFYSRNFLWLGASEYRATRFLTRRAEARAARHNGDGLAGYPAGEIKPLLFATAPAWAYSGPTLHDAIHAFRADRKTVYAVVHAREIISEASRRLPDPLLDRHPEIDWAVAAGGPTERGRRGIPSLAGRSLSYSRATDGSLPWTRLRVRRSAFQVAGRAEPLPVEVPESTRLNTRLPTTVADCQLLYP